MTRPPNPYDAELSPEAFDRKVAALLADEEDRASTGELIAWFTRRYPTPEARLAYVRHKVRALPGSSR